MSIMKVFVYFLCLITVVHSQDCKVSGKWCSDHEQCCGGCCFDGECIDTYRSCYSSLDVCADHQCINEENCFAFRPPECPGCEPLPLCREGLQ